MVIKDLERMNGWKDGYVLMNQSFKRDPITHEVIGIVF
jgi:hypothetical protein